MKSGEHRFVSGNVMWINSGRRTVFFVRNRYYIYLHHFKTCGLGSLLMVNRIPVMNRQVDMFTNTDLVVFCIDVIGFL